MSGFAEYEKSGYDPVKWNDAIEKRYPNGGVCDYCGKNAEFLHVYEESVCRNCIEDINKHCNTSFPITSIESGFCDFCGHYSSIPEMQGQVRIDICTECMARIGKQTRTNNHKKMKL